MAIANTTLTLETITALAPIIQPIATLASVIIGALFGYWLTKKGREPIIDVVTGDYFENNTCPLTVANLGDYPFVIRNLGYQKGGLGEIKYLKQLFLPTSLLPGQATTFWIKEKDMPWQDDIMWRNDYFFIEDGHGKIYKSSNPIIRIESKP